MNNISFNGNWFDNYYEKKLQITDIHSIYKIKEEFRKYRNVQSTMKYINTKTLKMAFITYSRMINSYNTVITKEKARGLDYISKEMYEKDLDNNINNLYLKLINGEYHTKPIKRTYIRQIKIKDNEIYYKERPLGIVNIDDAIVQISIVNQILYPIIEEILTKETFAYRNELSVQHAINYTTELIKQGYLHVISLDIKGYFNSINHEKLLNMLKITFKDKRLIKIIRNILKTDVYDIKQHKRITIQEGTEQGLIISPVLANLYLHYVLDSYYRNIKTKSSIRMIRYADDVLIFLKDKNDTKKVYKDIINRFNKYNLTISKEKTEILDLNKDEINYLGYILKYDKGMIEKNIPMDRISIKKEEINQIINNSEIGIKEESIRKKLNRAFNKYQYKDKYIRDMGNPLLGFYLQGYIKSINNRLNGIYKYYQDCNNQEVLDEVYDYTYTIFKSKWIGKIDYMDLMYILSNLFNRVEYLSYINLHKRPTRN